MMWPSRRYVYVVCADNYLVMTATFNYAKQGRIATAFAGTEVVINQTLVIEQLARMMIHVWFGEGQKDWQYL